MSAVETSSNHQKYQTGNPVVQALMRRFFATLRARVGTPEDLVDVGCGEGHALHALGEVLPARVRGCDLRPEAVAYCRERFPAFEFQEASVYALPFEDDAADVVLCLEVLEHLDDPARGLAELARVARGRVVVSVPWEPWFRLGSLARGKYLSSLGNHPEHVQHWSPARFRRFLEGSGHFRAVEVDTSFPWLVAEGTL